jgi:hypothetical protein
VSVNKWLHVNYSGGDPWVLKIWTAVRTASDRGKVAPLPEHLAELGLHISTRLNIVATLISRLNSGTDRLINLIGARKPHHEFTAPRNGYVFSLPRDFTYELLVDLDALLFELNSCCELIGRLFEALYQHAGRPLPRTPVGLTIREVVESAGQDARWFGRLDLHRNFFIHHGAPYFAVDLSDAIAERYDLLIMKRNLQSFENENDFVRYSELQQIVGGFQNAKRPVQSHLVRLFS